MNWFQRLMYGRCGADHLNLALLVGYFILSFLARLLRSSVLDLLALAALVWGVYRTFSRQLERRRAENYKFLALIRPLIQKYNVSKQRRNDKEHCYFKCPSCGQHLRVPRGKGKISITCRSCGVSFEEKT